MDVGGCGGCGGSGDGPAFTPLWLARPASDGGSKKVSERAGAFHNAEVC